MPVHLPGQSPGEPLVELQHPSRVVVIGANGSGKTRLGIWLDDNNRSSIPVHRISAQKALSLPDYAQVMNLEQAEKALYYGRSDEHAGVNRKNIDRWGSNPATHMLSDYDKLLSLLFASESARDRRHTQETRLSQGYVPVPDSAIDTIVGLWGYLMPHRSISLQDGKVLVERGTAGEYHAKEMSDGERVTLYLLGQCLTAPPGSMVIIDEPELHLHRSLMDKLWNKVEELSPDKTIVYITHDLDFAASRAGARKIWVQSFENNSWRWRDLPDDDTLPEALVIEIVGSRKPILFCEGDRGGLDHTIYQLCFPNHHVVPRGGCEKVIEAVKALNANAALHTVAAVGLVDKDVRTSEEVHLLATQNVKTIPFAEVENLLCNASVVRSVANFLALDPDATLAAVTDYVIGAITDELEVQIVLHAARRVRYHLSCYSPASNDRAGISEGINRLVAQVDVQAIVARSEADIKDAVSSGELNRVLEVYNRKSLADRIAPCFGLKHGEYKALVLRLLKSDRVDQLLPLIQQHMPSL